MAQDYNDFCERYNSALLKTMDAHGIVITSQRRPYSGQFQIIDSWSGPVDSATRIRKTMPVITADITFKGADADDQFQTLKRYQTDFNQIVGGEVIWNDGAPKERQIVVTLAADSNEVTDWPRQHAWLVAKITAFRLAYELFRNDRS
jgi:hypothetical protein